MNPSLNILGVRIRFQPFWLLGLLLLTGGIAAVGVPDAPPMSFAFELLMALLAALALVASYAIHEATHGIVGRRMGMPIDEVVMFGFIDLNKPAAEPPNGRAEALSALSGVIVSLVLALLLVGAWSALPFTTDDGSLLVRGVAWWAAAGNIALAAVNSALSYPYDGGRVIRGTLWALTGDKLRATRVASRIGRWFAFLLLFIAAMWALVTADLFYPLWLVVAGLFLLQSSRRQYRRLEIRQVVEGMTVGDVMDDNVAVVGPNLTLDTLFGQYERDDSVATYPVTSDGALVGSIDVGQIERVPRQNWARTRVGEVMTMLERLHTLTSGQSVMDALARFDHTTVEALVVVDKEGGDQLVGLVTRNGLIEKLRPRVRRMAEQDRALGSPR